MYTVAPGPGPVNYPVLEGYRFDLHTGISTGQSLGSSAISSCCATRTLQSVLVFLARCDTTRKQLEGASTYMIGGLSWR